MSPPDRESARARPFDRSRERRIGVLTDSVSGTFLLDDVDDLLHFCTENPTFHIVTYLSGGVFVNRYDQRGGQFKLADGDADPAYMLDARPFLRAVLPIDNI